MNKYEYLNEERYQKSKKKVSLIAMVILLIGLCAGGSLIYLGISKNKEINANYSEESAADLNTKLADEKAKLETRKKQLQAAGVTYSATTNYEDGDSYELKIITEALDPSFEYCSFNEYKTNSATATYCSLKADIKEISSDFNKSFETHKSIPYFMFGGFIILASCMIAGSVYMMTKRREILAFSAQQVMPVAKEGIEQMAPSMGKVAKEITKGVKEGMKD